MHRERHDWVCGLLQGGWRVTLAEEEVEDEKRKDFAKKKAQAFYSEITLLHDSFKASNESSSKSYWLVISLRAFKFFMFVLSCLIVKSEEWVGTHCSLWCATISYKKCAECIGCQSHNSLCLLN